MENRTFLRTMLDIIFNNTVLKAIANFFAWKKYYKTQNYEFVNFCNNNEYFPQKELKFLKNMPLNKKEVEQYDNRFLFNGKLKTDNRKLV